MEDYLLREQAAIALGKIGPAAKSAVPSLQIALRDEYPEIRRAAAEALKRIGAP
jgi:HEAT repeat protein